MNKYLVIIPKESYHECAVVCTKDNHIELFYDDEAKLKGYSTFGVTVVRIYEDEGVFIDLSAQLKKINTARIEEINRMFKATIARIYEDEGFKLEGEYDDAFIGRMIDIEEDEGEEVKLEGAVGNMAGGESVEATESKYESHYESLEDTQEIPGASIALRDENAMPIVEETSMTEASLDMLNVKHTSVSKEVIKRFGMDFDTRIPNYYVAGIYNGRSGFIVHTKQSGTQNEYYIPEEDKLNPGYEYHFYPMDVEGLKVQPEILIDMLAKHRDVCKDVKFDDKAMLFLNKVDGLFDNDDIKARRDEITNDFYQFFMRYPEFRITYISWDTGYVTALTPEKEQVLIIAANRTGNISKRSFNTFIPVNHDGKSDLYADIRNTKEQDDTYRRQELNDEFYKNNKLGLVIIGMGFKAYSRLAMSRG